MNITNTNLSFHSTIIPRNASKPFNGYMKALKDCNFKTMAYDSVENCYKKLINDAKESNISTGVLLSSEEDVLLRILGHSLENDKYIYSQLKKVDNNVRYINDFPSDGLDNELFDIIR